MPKLSVILPFYNSENTILRAINSIKNQSFTNFECIIIDNNSTDRSRELILKTIKDDKRFILTEEAKQGVVFASNRGSKLAKGKYIARMDSDDECYTDRFEQQVHFLETNKDYGAVSGLVEFVGNKKTSKGFAKYVDWVNSVDTYESIMLKRFIESPIINPSAMWRKEVSDKYGIYRESDLPEDYELWLRWLSKGVKIGKTNNLVLRWYDSESRLTRTDKRYSNEAFYKAKSPYLSEYLKEINTHYPKVVIWGASRISRNRAKLLQEFGVEISSYIDISNKRHISDTIIYYKDIPSKNEIFILVYVRQDKMRNQIQSYLSKKGFVEGENYLLVS
jgi:glycosyltransferase involved in cell wall biosynthesis